MSGLVNSTLIKDELCYDIAFPILLTYFANHLYFYIN